MFVRTGVSAAIIVALACYSQTANATTDFFCTSNAAKDEVSIGANTGHELGALPLMPPDASPTVLIGGKPIDLSQATISVEHGWTVIRNRVKGALVVAYRKTAAEPRFLPDRRYPFCSKDNWRGFCWSAQLKYPLSNGRMKTVSGVCGEG